MKKYLLFGYEDFYPEGGVHDFVDSFDSIDEAKAYTDEDRKDRYQIVDRDTMKILWTAYGSIHHQTDAEIKKLGRSYSITWSEYSEATS